MRSFLVILFFLPLVGFAQFKEGWKSLPVPKIIPAEKHILKAHKVSEKEKQLPFKAKEIYTNELPEFVRIVKPDTLPNLKFDVFPVQYENYSDFTSNFFKDISKANIKYIDKIKGLHSNSIKSIAEDENGLIYFSSDNGLLCYNGQNSYLIKGVENFPLLNINRLFFDKKERLWIATDKGLVYIKKRKLYVANFKFEGLILSFKESLAGDLLIATEKDGVLIQSQDKLLQYNKGLSQNHISDVIRASNNSIWIGYVNRGIAFIRNDSLFEFKRKGETETARFFMEDDNQLWIGTYYGSPYLYRNDSLFLVQLNEKNDKYTTHNIAKNSKGIWFARYGYGINLLKTNGEVASFTLQDGLVDNSAYGIHIDTYQNVWVNSLFNGVSRIDENIFYGVKQQITGFVSDIKVDEKGNKWYFKNGGLLTQETDTKFIEYVNDTNDFIFPTNHALYGFIKNNVVWMSNYNNGLTKLSNNQYTFYRISNDFFDNSIVAIHPNESDNSVWCNTLNNRFLKFKNDTFYDYTKSKLWSNLTFLSINQLRNGWIYAATKEQGILLIKKNQFLKLNDIKIGLPQEINKIFVNLRNEFMFFSDGKIHLLSANQDLKIISHPILKNISIYAIEEISPNKYLLSCDKGILLVEHKNNNFDFKFYDSSYGLNIFDNETIKLIDDEILVVGKNGVFLWDFYYKINELRKPKLTFNNYHYNDSVYFINTKINIEQYDLLELNFNKIAWGTASKLYYSIQKNNSAIIWKEQLSNTIIFNQLGFGNYKLKVYAVSENNKSEPIELMIYVKPYFHQTWWFKLILISLVIGIIFLYFNQKRKKALRIQKELEQKVTEKTADLELEKKEVIKQLTEKELLLKEVNHRVKNNFQMVSSLLELQSSFTKNKETKDNLKLGILRIKSLALAHQKLYQNQYHNTLNLNEYINSIIIDVTTNTGIKVSYTQDKDYVVDVEKAQAIGFIINELITNSIKHAWNKSSVIKQIKISIINHKGEITLKYNDNGIGFKEKFDFNNIQSLGSVLINSFINRQLMGNIKVTTDNGAKTTITFNEAIFK